MDTSQFNKDKTIFMKLVGSDFIINGRFVDDMIDFIINGRFVDDMMHIPTT